MRQKPAWYNWTGDGSLDPHCAAAWVIVFIPTMVILITAVRRIML
jgi:hypothetical protein